MPNDYLTQVLEKLEDNPTSADLDFFLEAFARVGYLAATAQLTAEQCENTRKHNEAKAFIEARRDGAKSAVDAQAMAAVAVRSERDSEATARATAAKLKHLLNSIEQVINGIKYLGRQTDAPMNLPRR